MLTPWIVSGQADTAPPAVTFNALPTLFNATSSPRDVRKAATAALIRQIGEDSATLLKNAAGALPLGVPARIAIIGSDAGPNALSALDGNGGANFPSYNTVRLVLLFVTSRRADGRRRTGHSPLAEGPDGRSRRTW